jgi:hypothetical protein
MLRHVLMQETFEESNDPEFRLVRVIAAEMGNGRARGTGAHESQAELEGGAGNGAETCTPKT